MRGSLKYLPVGAVLAFLMFFGTAQEARADSETFRAHALGIHELFGDALLSGGASKLTPVAFHLINDGSGPAASSVGNTSRSSSGSVQISFSVTHAGTQFDKTSAPSDLGLHFFESADNKPRQSLITSVPEPATLLLVGAGLVGIAGRVRQRFKSR